MPLIRKAPEATAKSAGGPPDDIGAGLASSDADERWNAARTAAETPGSEPALALALERENNPRVREALFTALARLASSKSVEIVITYLRSDDANIRTGAMDAMRAMPLRTEEYLPELLQDTDPDVRLLACDLVRVVVGSSGLELLGSLIETDADSNVCGAAVEVLAEIGDERVIPALAVCATRFPQDAFLGFAIKTAIARLTGRPVRG